MRFPANPYGNSVITFPYLAIYTDGSEKAGHVHDGIDLTYSLYYEVRPIMDGTIMHDLWSLNLDYYGGRYGYRDERLIVVEHDIPGLGLQWVRYSHLIGRLRAWKSNRYGKQMLTQTEYIGPQFKRGDKVSYNRTNFGLVHPEKGHLHLSFMKPGLWPYTTMMSRKFIEANYHDPALYIKGLQVIQFGSL